MWVNELLKMEWKSLSVKFCEWKTLFGFAYTFDIPDTLQIKLNEGN